MRRLALAEHHTTHAVPLSRATCDALRDAVPDLSITPSRGLLRRYDLTPGARCGTVSLPSLTVEIQPKAPIRNVLFLAAYALDPRMWRDGDALLERTDSLLDAAAAVFLDHVRRALKHGPLTGYRERDETARTLRGRLRIGDQLRARPGLLLPTEVSYDDYTVDLQENRILKAALRTLEGCPPRLPGATRAINEALRALGGVTDVEGARALSHVSYSRVRSSAPQTLARRNRHYRPALALAHMLLEGASVDLAPPGSAPRRSVPARAFLLDMNRTVEAFTVVALREALHLSARAFSPPHGGSALTLDRAGTVPLRPDLTWWHGGRCVFAGDVKYKDDPGRSDDLYQALAYASATGLPGALLVYAGTDAPPLVHEVARAGKTLYVATLDLSVPPRDILDQVRALAGRVRRLRDAVRHAGAA